MFKNIASAVGFVKDEPYHLFIVMSIIYLILGTFVDSLGMMLLTVPIFLLLVAGIGFRSHLVWRLRRQVDQDRPDHTSVGNECLHCQRHRRGQGKFGGYLQRTDVVHCN